MADRSVTIAVTTFRREELLPALLAEIQRQALAQEGIAARIVVVDNDPLESARSAVAAAGADYAPEPTPGIAAARQRVLDEAADADLVVMVDDDVMPEAGWLAELLTVWARFRPTVVSGYVRWIWPDVEEPVIRKIRAGGFMRRPDVPTGGKQTWLATGNVLIDMHEVRRLGLSFDRSLGLSGGEDTLFGELILRRGGTIMSARESSVAAAIPPDRSTAEFARQRAIGQGTSISHLRLRGTRGMRRVLVSAGILVAGATRFAVFSAARVVGRLTGSEAVEGKYLRKAWTATGRLKGAIGHVSGEYSRPDED